MVISFFHVGNSIYMGKKTNILRQLRLYRENRLTLRRGGSTQSHRKTASARLRGKKAFCFCLKGGSSCEVSAAVQLPSPLPSLRRGGYYLKPSLSIRGGGGGKSRFSLPFEGGGT